MLTTETMPTSIWQTSLHNFKKSAHRLQLKDHLSRELLGPKERIEMRIHCLDTKGEHHTFSAFIVRHNDMIGPAKGGIRMTADVNIDDVSGLAMEMSWKTALIGVPFGGGKAAIQIDPRGLSSQDKEIIVRAFTRRMLRHIGPELYVPAPDMGTSESNMAHISDCISFSEGLAITRGCFVTGKPVIVGGIIGRREATGKGVAYTTLAACEKLNIDIRKATVVLQGFGNVGSVAALAMYNKGATVIAVGDYSGGIYCEDGLDIEALIQYVDENECLTGFPGSDPIDNADVLELNCDILIPAATQSQITVDNAPHIKAKIIAEGANAPTTPSGDEILNERGIFVIPDILCNAGGVFVSYLEYTQETQREQWTLEDVRHRLEERMISKFEEVLLYSQSHEITLREAAMDIGVLRVAQATEARGFMP